MEILKNEPIIAIALIILLVVPFFIEKFCKDINSLRY